MRYLNSLEFTTFINTLANIIASNLSDSELAILSAIFTQLGDTLATISILRESGNGEDKI